MKRLRATYGGVVDTCKPERREEKSSQKVFAGSRRRRKLARRLGMLDLSPWMAGLESYL